MQHFSRLARRITFKSNTWNVLTVSVSLPDTLRVYLNGEAVLELSAATMPEQALTALDHDSLAAIKEAASAALAFDGPFALDPLLGFRLFGDYRTKGAKGAPVKKDLRSVTMTSRLAATCDVWTEHTAHGAWRCKSPNCKKADPRDGTDPQNNPHGFRNAPDALECSFCNAAREDSETAPTPNPHPDHPGLWIVTCDNFEEMVLRSEQHVFLLVSADWCPPSKACCLPPPACLSAPASSIVSVSCSHSVVYLDSHYFSPATRR